ncbi:hypothetical protein C8F04DRAFT_1070184 [Mycena alexandri]|uniref:Uncharacterized protein n=1 Tax=Mycena alexandri TaxID=1745969 RepID=A0AAD6XGE9_9AGAR|nr:hypothetical protein C8F04DRAFT_1070184 [Mycena alexandri]
MAGNPNTLIVLGSSPDSYFIGHGRRHFVENMPESFTNHAKTDLNISMTLWISVSKTLDTWISYNTATAKFHFNGDINQDIRDHLSGTNGKARAEFVSFPDDEDSAHYFLKGKNDGAWSAVLQTYYIEKLTKMKAELLNFDAGFTGMIFGKGKTHICTFKAGFLANFDEDEIDSREHPLYKVLAQYEEGWCIERGSTLCFYDSRYFYLKFKRPGHSEIKMHWNLPSNMAEKLSALREQAEQPEEMMTLMQEEQGWIKVAQMRMNHERQMNNMLCEQIEFAGLSMLAAGTGGTIVRKYY